MNVDIGNDKVFQNFSTFIESAELRKLNKRLQSERARASKGRDPNSPVSPRAGTNFAAATHQTGGHREKDLRRSSCDVNSPRLSSPLQQPPCCSSPSHHASTSSREWLASTAPLLNHGSAAPPLELQTSSLLRRINTNSKVPVASPSGAAAVSQAGGPSPTPMTTVSAAQQRQRSWTNAAPNVISVAQGVADGAGPRPSHNASNSKMAGDGSRRGEEANASRGDGGGAAGSANHQEKPAAAPGPLHVARTKIQIGMRLRRWIIVNRIGAGSFGETFTAVEVDGPVAQEDSLTVTSENLMLLNNLPPPEERTEVCIKVEEENKNVLRLEALALKKVQPCLQVVRYLGSGCTHGMNYLVMVKLGSNLAELRRNSLHGTFNIYTTLKAGISCLTAIRGVHDLGLIHRDIKPSNFVTGLAGTPDHSTCYLIDFGLARRFRRSNGEIRPPRDSAGFRGTSRYASLASHRHQELGRVDDLWSLLFMLVEFATGALPWRRYKDKDDIGRCKEESINPLLVRSLPREFQPFLAHLQTLRYEDEPDYELLLTLMYRALERRGYPPKKPVEWEVDASTFDSVMDGEAAAAAVDGDVRGGAVGRQHVNPTRNDDVNGYADGVEKGPQFPPRRAAPQLGFVEVGPPDTLPSPVQPPSGRAASEKRTSLNGVRPIGHPPDNLLPHNSGTLRISEVDVNEEAAADADDRVPYDGPMNAALAYWRQGGRHVQEATTEAPVGTVAMAQEGSETRGGGGELMNSDEDDRGDFSPRDGDDVIGDAPRSPQKTAYNTGAFVPQPSKTGNSAAVASPAASGGDPLNVHPWREATDDLHLVQRRASRLQRRQQQQDGVDQDDDAEVGLMPTGAPPQSNVASTADVEFAAGTETADEAARHRRGKTASKAKREKASSKCHCAVL